MPLTKYLRIARGLPGVLKARHLAEVAVTPHVRGHLAEVRAQAQDTDNLTAHLVHHAAVVDAQLAALHQAQPLVLNAIATANGVARTSQRELTRLRQVAEDAQDATADRLDAADTRMMGVAEQLQRVEGRMSGLELHIGRVDRLEEWVVARSDESARLIELWRAELSPHVDSVRFLLERVEMVRAEMLHELRYSSPRAGATDTGSVHGTEPGYEIPQPAASKIVRPDALTVADLRLNLGSGHVPVAGYVNVDMRELPGVDVVADLSSLPVDPGSVAEVFSSHVLEHFPREHLVRNLLPYWCSLLRPGGIFRAIVPDIDAMSRAYVNGEIDFDSFREVLYGGQEYEGDTHFNGFSPDDLCEILRKVGLTEATVIAASRPSGVCLEVEIIAKRPLS